MNLFEKIIFALKEEAEKPTDYGWFHLMFIGLVVISTVLLCVFCRNIKDKTFRKVVAILWAVIVLFEIYKQLVYSYSGVTDKWDFQWYAFPYQFCSTPLYLLPFVAFMKDCKIRDGVIMFIATFSLFAGLCVYCAPGDVFNTSLLGIQIQTMVHHGVQIVLGVYSVVYYINKLTIKNLFFAIIVFVAMLTIAVLLNVLVYNFIQKEETFNMFFISPYFPCTLPILGGIYEKVHYIFFFFIYTFGFSLCATIVFGVIYGVKAIISKRIINGKENN